MGNKACEGLDGVGTPSSPLDGVLLGEKGLIKGAGRDKKRGEDVYKKSGGQR